MVRGPPLERLLGLIWGLNTTWKRSRWSSHGVLDANFQKSRFFNDVSYKITLFGSPWSLQNQSWSFSKVRFCSQMRWLRETIFHGLKKVKKSHAGISTARRKPPEGPYIRNIENGDGGLNRPQMTMETDMTEACRKMRRWAAWSMSNLIRIIQDAG